MTFEKWGFREVVDKILFFAMKEISVKDLVEMMGGKTQDELGKIGFVDVRTPQECEAVGMMPNFVNIPLDTLASRLPDLQKYDKIYFSCRSGVRSASACEFVRINGFEDVWNVKEGILGFLVLNNSN